MRTEVTRWSDGSLQILLHLTPEELGGLKQQDGTEPKTLEDPNKGKVLVDDKSDYKFFGIVDPKDDDDEDKDDE